MTKYLYNQVLDLVLRGIQGNTKEWDSLL